MTRTGAGRSRDIEEMVTHARRAVWLSSRTCDFDLIRSCMATCYDNGFDSTQLYDLRHEGKKAYGIIRDTYLGCVVTSFTGKSAGITGDRYAVWASTTGSLAGTWVFVLDDAPTLVAARNHKPCRGLDGLSGFDLMDAVIASALTEAIPTPAERRRQRFRR